MKVLDVIDLKDYLDGYIIDERFASRAIIVKNGKLLMVYSNKGEYKFPGGGIDDNESKIDALIREVREETGLVVIKDSIKEFGEIIEKRKSNLFSKTIFIHHSYYYICNVEENIKNQILDEYEKLENFRLVEVNPKDAYEYNMNSTIKHTLRENKVLQILIESNFINCK